VTFVQATTQRVSRGRIPGGDAGVMVTAETMKRLADERTPLLAETAANIMWGAGESITGAVEGVRRFVTEAVRYVPDAWNAEVVRSPTYMLRRIQRSGVAYGDCDDMATLAAALGLALGIPARYVLVGFNGGPLEHVFTELWTPDGWVTVDPSKPADWTQPANPVVRVPL